MEVVVRWGRWCYVYGECRRDYVWLWEIDYGVDEGLFFCVRMDV